MKLLIITSVIEFENDIKLMLINSEIKLFSYQPVTSYRSHTTESIEDNWFASQLNETDSIMFYAFVAKKNADTLLNNVTQFNEQQKTLSKVHVVILDIEKSN